MIIAHWHRNSFHNNLESQEYYISKLNRTFIFFLYHYSYTSKSIFPKKSHSFLDLIAPFVALLHEVVTFMSLRLSTIVNSICWKSPLWPLVKLLWLVQWALFLTKILTPLAAMYFPLGYAQYFQNFHLIIWNFKIYWLKWCPRLM